MKKFDFLPMKKVTGGKSDKMHEFEGYILVPARVEFEDDDAAGASVQASSLKGPLRLAKWILPPEIRSLGEKQTLREQFEGSIGLPWELVAFEDMSYPGPKGK
ncbi:MAG: hypothetical protein WAO69_12060 [Aestuariivita sp.]|uniref:hypothetical protein n=1 Tax=Aestuariivita sp. TaxID=1872407 RepID=UPI003BAEF0BC